MSSQQRRRRFSLTARFASVWHAVQGLGVLLREQHNVRIHLLAALVAVALAVLLGLSAVEWLALILVIGWVLALEAFNSALEYLCDVVSEQPHPLVAKAKDVAAAAVLISALTAALIGLLIFLPKIWLLFQTL